MLPSSNTDECFATLECGGDFVWSSSGFRHRLEALLLLWDAAPSGFVRSQMRPKVIAIKKNTISPMPTSLKM